MSWFQPAHSDCGERLPAGGLLGGSGAAYRPNQEGDQQTLQWRGESECTFIVLLIGPHEICFIRDSFFFHFIQWIFSKPFRLIVLLDSVSTSIILGYRPEMVCAHIYTFPADRICNAAYHLITEVIRKLLSSVFWVKLRVLERFCWLCRLHWQLLRHVCIFWKGGRGVSEVTHRWSYTLATHWECPSEIKTFLFLPKTEFQWTNRQFCDILGLTTDLISIGKFCDSVHNSVILEIRGPCINSRIQVQLKSNLLV